MCACNAVMHNLDLLSLNIADRQLWQPKQMWGAALLGVMQACVLNAAAWWPSWLPGRYVCRRHKGRWPVFNSILSVSRPRASPQLVRRIVNNVCTMACSSSAASDRAAQPVAQSDQNEVEAAAVARQVG